MLGKNTRTINRAPVRWTAYCWPSAEMDVLAVTRASRLAALWSLGYGLYRAYYALGGTAGMPGVPLSQAEWVRINSVAAVLLFTTAVLALGSPRAWTRPWGRRMLLVFCWIVTVACVGHALINIVERIASLNGAVTISYPFWQSIDRRQADLQDLFFNEPWFFIEGILWARIAWVAQVQKSPRRVWWVGSLVVAIVAATTFGVLVVFGVIERVIAG